MKHTYHLRGLLRRVAGLLSLLALAAPRAQAQSAIYYTQGSSTATLDALNAVAPAGGTGASLAAGSANFSQPTDVVVDAAGGFVYVADQYVGTGAIYRYKTDGSGRTTVVSGAAGVSYNGLALDAANSRLYYTQAGATASQAAVKVVSLAGALPAAGTGVATLPGTFLRPGDLALNAAAGVLYVADQYTGSGSIARVTLSTGATTTLVTGTANATYNGLALDAANSRLYFTQGSADAAADALKVLNLSTSLVTTLTSGSAQFSQPTDLAFDPVAGQLYLTDQYVGTGALLRYTVGAGGTTVSGRTALVAATAGAAYGGLALALNQAPVLAASTGAVTAPEQVATVIDAGITVADADNSTLASGTVSITSGLVSAEDALTFTANVAAYGNIAGSYGASTGVLTLTSAGATATLAQWQAALRSVTYRNASDAPTTAARTISFVVNDGTQNSNVATRTLNVEAINDAPVNTVPGAQTTPYNTALTFSTANGNAVSVADADAGTAIITVTLTPTNGVLNVPGNIPAAGPRSFRGNQTNLTSLLNGFQFQPTSGFAGAASVQVATNDEGNTGTGGPLTTSSTIAITVGAATLTIAPGTLPGSTVGVAYSQTLTTSGGTGPYTYALVAGSGALPAGLTLTTGGVLSGTPTASGSFSFSVRSTDASTGTGPFSATQAYTLSVAAPTLTIAPASLPNGTAGTAYSQTLSTSGGVSPYAYTLASGTLPTGLTLATSGVLSGTPTASGPFTFTVRTTDASTGTGPATATRSYTLIINAPTIALTPTTLPGGTVGTAYSQTITASGGVSPYTYAIVAGSGALPTGLTLTAGGVLSGTPTAAGTFNFTLQATDASTGNGPTSGTQAYSVTIAAPALTVWTGNNQTTNWFEAGNWTLGVPGAATSALIPVVSNPYPVLTTGTPTALNLTLNAGASLTQQGSTLDLKGDFINNGTYTASAGTLSLSGSASQRLGGSSATRCYNLSVGSSGSTLTGPAAVQQVLTLNGDLTTSGLLFTLESTPASTALVVNSGGVVVGSATVQRAIDPTPNPATGAGSNPLGLGYRHYSSPVQSTTVSDLATAGFAPEVSQASTYNTSATPGATNPFPTVYGYDQSRLATVTSNYAAFDKGFVVPAGLSAPLERGRGYVVNIGANEVVDFVGTLTNNVVPLTLSRNAVGTANAASAGWQLVGNPYPAPLNYSLVAAADRLNLDAAIYVYNSTSRYTGQYRAYINGIGNPVLPVGQAFFVRVTDGQTSGALTFRNSQRLTANTTTTFQRTTADSRPQVQLALQGSGGSADVATLYFESGATPGLDTEYDARKLPNPSGLNLSTTAAGVALAVDGRPLLSAGTSLTVPLQVYVPATGTYTLQAAELLNLNGLRPYLRDLQLGTLTDLTQQASYSFTQSGTFTGARFELVFSPTTALAAAPAVLAQQVVLYPNPATGVAYVQLPAALGRQAVTATLLDAVGRAVRTLSLPAQGTLPHELSLSELATGVYALRLETSAGTVVRRLTVE